MSDTEPDRQHPRALPYESEVSPGGREPLISNQVCPKCAGAMAVGYLLDKGHQNVVNHAAWVDGTPEVIRFLGMFAGYRTKGRRLLKIDAFRCVKCGYLELYATQE